MERGDEHSLSGGVALRGNVHVVKKASQGKATHTFTPTKGNFPFKNRCPNKNRKGG